MKQSNRFLVDEEEIKFEEIPRYLFDKEVSFVHIKTIENEKILLDGYFIFKNQEDFLEVLKKASKAQIPF